MTQEKSSPVTQTVRAKSSLLDKAKWKARLEKYLRKIGLELTSTTEARLTAMRKHHRWQQHNLQAAKECEYDRISDYLRVNKMLRVEAFSEGQKCGGMIGYTIRLDESIFMGIRPGDPYMESVLEHGLLRACKWIIHRRSFQRNYVD